MQPSRHFSSQNRDKVGTSKAHDFTIKFDPVLKLASDMKHELAVNRIAMTYSWQNITPEYKNDTIRYSADSGSTWGTIIFVNGMYPYTDVDDYIDEVIKKDGNVKADKTYSINLTFV